RQVDVVFGARALARLGDRDLVGAADAQAAGGVAAARVGAGAADRARFDVGDDHVGAGNRLPAAVGDEAAHARGRALGENGGGGERGDQADREFRQPDAVAVGHGGGLDAWGLGIGGNRYRTAGKPALCTAWAMARHASPVNFRLTR